MCDLYNPYTIVRSSPNIEQSTKLVGLSFADINIVL